jgi:hypothetical protein
MAAGNARSNLRNLLKSRDICAVRLKCFAVSMVARWIFSFRKDEEANVVQDSRAAVEKN